MSESLDEAREKYANGYYAKKLEIGLEFQDVMTRALYQRGIVVIGYASRRFQQTHGENMLGAEIKRDDRFRETGNLYIETAEKAHPDRVSYTPSGIDRGDNSWLFVIGDERTAWIFSTKYIRLLRDQYAGSRWRTTQTPTSQGFLVPIADANRYAIRRLNLDEEGDKE